MPASARQRPRSLADRLLADAGGDEITAAERAAAAEASFRPVPRALLVPIERLAPSHDNPRKAFDDLDELAASIAERGVLQPLVVRPEPERPGYFVTVVGARRLLAARIVQTSAEAAERARVAALPCVVTDEVDRDAYADALLENLARKDLSRAEVMAALLRLQQEFGWSARYIARRTGRSVSDVAELLKVAKDESVAGDVRAELITPSVAGQIQRLPPPLREAVLQEVHAGRSKTVEDIKRLRRRATTPPGDEGRPNSDAPTSAAPAALPGPAATDVPDSRDRADASPPTMPPARVSEFGHPADAIAAGATGPEPVGASLAPGPEVQALLAALRAFRQRRPAVHGDARRELRALLRWVGDHLDETER